jgi:hypothetical protein
VSLEADSLLSPEEQAPPSVTFASGGVSWTRVRTPRLLSRLARGLYAAAAVGAVATAMSAAPSLAALSIFGSVLAWPLMILSYILSLTQTTFAGGLAVSRTELVVHGPGSKRKFIPLSRIAGAVVVHREVFGGFVPTVEVELTSGDRLTARLPDPRSAAAVVKALGFGPGGRRVHVSLAKPTRRLFNPLMGAIAYVAGMFLALGPIASAVGSAFDGAFALYPLLALLVYAGLKRLLRAPKVTIGEDGILLERRFGRTFVPRADITFVSSAGSTLVVERRSGKRDELRGFALDPARLMAVAQVVEERSKAAPTTADRFTHYESGGRLLAEWRAHLAQAMNQASYRHNAATVDEAAAVLHSAEATPEQRVGAALALRVAGQPTERIRVAVDAAADERVRAALEAVAEARDGDVDDPAVEKELRRLLSRDRPRIARPEDPR